LSKVAESAIVSAANAQTKLHQQIKDMLEGAAKGSSGSTKPGGEGEDDGAETKKADVWWRSFSKWVGDKYSSVADKVSTAGSWFSTLATGLASILLAPKLYETIAKKAKDLLTWDNIKAAAVKTWDYVYDKGKTAINWVIDKLGLGPAIDKAKAVFEKLADAVSWISKKLGITDKTKTIIKDAVVNAAKAIIPGGAILDAARGVSGAASWVKGKLGSGSTAKTKTTGAQASGMLSAGAAGAPDASGGASAASAPSTSTDLKSLAGNSSSKAGNPGQPAGNNTFGFTNNTTPGGTTVNQSSTFQGTSGTTTSTPATQVRNTPAVTTPVAGSAPASATNARAVPPSQSTSTVGINSFGFTSGVDDSLPLMNLGVIAG